MEISTIIGLIIGIVCIVAGIMQQGVISDYIDVASLLIVLGGVLAATIVNYKLDKLKSLGKIIGIAFKKKDFDMYGTIYKIIDLANLARKDGLFALDNKIKEIDDPFMKKGLMLVVDGTDPELLKNILETDLVLMEERHSDGTAILYSMSSYSPAFGMIGTLIGLISMLKNLNDANTLGKGMATALITTLYGCIFANLLFTPLAGKLKTFTEQEMRYKELILEGLLSIQAGENPRLIEEKLIAFVTKAEAESGKKPDAGSGTSEEN